jgi:hypothetical protein
MDVWLGAARAAAALNVVLLAGLSYVWLDNYRDHRARHTLGLLVFAVLLFVQNVLWLYFYVLHPDFIAWFVNSGTDVRAGVTLLCGLELGALVFLGRITFT